MSSAFAQTPYAIPAVPKLRNGSMEWGNATPEDWQIVLDGGGMISFTRDIHVKVNGQSSLHIAAPAGGEGSVIQRMAAMPMTTFRVRGVVKLSGDIQSQIWAQFLDQNGNPIGSQAVGVFAGARDWTEFTAEVGCPEDIRELKFGINTTGKGDIWIDRIQFEPIAGMSVAPNAVPPPTFPQQDPVVPYPGLFQGDLDIWLSLHERQKRQIQAQSPEVVFLGDSITELWDKTLWNRYFGKLNAANCGIRGDRTNQVLYRIQDGLLDGLMPRLVVVAVGVNNLWKDKYGPQRTADAVKLICGQIHDRIPEAQILVVGIFPTDRNADSAFRWVVPEVNKAIRKVADGKTVRFVDFGTKFLEPDGSISKSVMPDGLHLSSAGYTIYARNLAPVIYSILGRA